MTQASAKYPAWGVLVEAPLERVRHILDPLSYRFDLRSLIFRTSGSWTAVFNMEPGDTADDEAAAYLRLRGLMPVYRFDFSKYEYFTWRWDGARWELDRDPTEVLGEVGIEIPGWDEEAAPPDPKVAIVSRDASILEGVSVETARELVPHQLLRIGPGSHGAIIYDPDVETRIELWRRAPGRVFEIVFYPRSGNFRFRIMKGDECMGTFKPGETRTWDATPFMADVEGETTPEGIVDKFGLERSFLARFPETHDAAPSDEAGSSPAKRGSSDY